jgi:hypothetical protein
MCAAAASGLAIGGGTAGSGENGTAGQVAINLWIYVPGRIGRTFRFDHPCALPEFRDRSDLARLVDAMNSGAIAAEMGLERFLLIAPSMAGGPQTPFGWAELLITAGFLASFALTYTQSFRHNRQAAAANLPAPGRGAPLR